MWVATANLLPEATVSVGLTEGRPQLEHVGEEREQLEVESSEGGEGLLEGLLINSKYCNANGGAQTKQMKNQSMPVVV